MSKKISMCVLSAIVVLALSAMAFAATPSRVFTNVTTNDVNKAAMAIKFTHGIMKAKGMSATIFFNVYGVELVDKNRPSPVYPTGQSVSQMLAEFIKDGGTVLACPMCMKNVGGMTNDDLLQGVSSREGAGLAAITQPDTLVLSY